MGQYSLPHEFDAEQHEYLRVHAVGQMIDKSAHLVKAVTEIGPGSWLMMPLMTDQGVLWVNRGFVPVGRKTPADWAAPPVEFTGLLRSSEPDGTLLEPNDPEGERWVSRDTMAMSRVSGLGQTLPYFLDADHAGEPGTWPRGGLTVVTFRNTHLSYALTWYAMALLFAVALIWVVRRERKLD